MNPAFVKGFKDAIDSDPGGPVTHFGEFFIGRPDPKYEEYRTFPDRTGVNNLDFEYYNANRQAFGDFSRSMSDFGLKRCGSGCIRVSAGCGCIRTG
ncbi:hypothetical protein ABD76_01195 [Paenibacillus dendritiformis]|uniref:hypothetical protein n=1 Tax=Paenibacillus dendritiformis TaxID=130049 RepID=UPI0018CE2B1D|nr:hypothetical protein [Paenibacillus dendritiformis]MBG9791224.1 hypothetical protein [Paenibacillus dendritiformis]